MARSGAGYTTPRTPSVLAPLVAAADDAERRTASDRGSNAVEQDNGADGLPVPAVPAVGSAPGRRGIEVEGLGIPDEHRSASLDGHDTCLSLPTEQALEVRVGGASVGCPHLARSTASCIGCAETATGSTPAPQIGFVISNTRRPSRTSGVGCSASPQHTLHQRVDSDFRFALRRLRHPPC